MEPRPAATAQTPFFAGSGSVIRVWSPGGLHPLPGAARQAGRGGEACRPAKLRHPRELGFGFRSEPSGIQLWAKALAISKKMQQESSLLLQSSKGSWGGAQIPRTAPGQGPSKHARPSCVDAQVSSPGSGHPGQAVRARTVLRVGVGGHCKLIMGTTIMGINQTVVLHFRRDASRASSLNALSFPPVCMWYLYHEIKSLKKPNPKGRNANSHVLPATESEPHLASCPFPKCCTNNTDRLCFCSSRNLPSPVGDTASSKCLSRCSQQKSSSLLTPTPPTGPRRLCSLFQTPSASPQVRNLQGEVRRCRLLDILRTSSSCLANLRVAPSF